MLSLALGQLPDDRSVSDCIDYIQRCYHCYSVEFGIDHSDKLKTSLATICDRKHSEVSRLKQCLIP